MGTIQEALAKLLRKRGGGNVDSEAAEAKAGAEKMASKLPSAVMPLDAVKKKKARLQQLDEETKE